MLNILSNGLPLAMVDPISGLVVLAALTTGLVGMARSKLTGAPASRMARLFVLVPAGLMVVGLAIALPMTLLEWRKEQVARSNLREVTAEIDDLAPLLVSSRSNHRCGTARTVAVQTIAGLDPLPPPDRASDLTEVTIQRQRAEAVIDHLAGLTEGPELAGWTFGPVAGDWQRESYRRDGEHNGAPVRIGIDRTWNDEQSHRITVTTWDGAGCLPSDWTGRVVNGMQR